MLLAAQIITIVLCWFLLGYLFTIKGLRSGVVGFKGPAHNHRYNFCWCKQLGWSADQHKTPESHYLSPVRRKDQFNLQKGGIALGILFWPYPAGALVTHSCLLRAIKPSLDEQVKALPNAVSAVEEKEL